MVLGVATAGVAIVGLVAGLGVAGLAGGKGTRELARGRLATTTLTTVPPPAPEMPEVPPAPETSTSSSSSSSSTSSSTRPSSTSTTTSTSVATTVVTETVTVPPTETVPLAPAAINVVYSQSSSGELLVPRNGSALIQLVNVGGQDGQWTMTLQSSGYRVTPTSGSLAGGQTARITVTDTMRSPHTGQINAIVAPGDRFTISLRTP